MSDEEFLMEYHHNPLFKAQVDLKVEKRKKMLKDNKKFDQGTLEYPECSKEIPETNTLKAKKFYGTPSERILM